MSQLNAKLWTVDFPAYLAQIEAAQTVEEVEAIEVGYESPAEVVDVTIAPEEGTGDGEISAGGEDSPGSNDGSASGEVVGAPQQGSEDEQS